MSIFIRVQASLTRLHRKTRKSVRRVIHRQENVTITKRGEPCARIVPASKIDRKAAFKALRALGPVDLAARK